MAGLFGEEFDINLNNQNVKSLLKKINSDDLENIDTKKVLNSKSISIEDRLAIIKEKVLRVLGKQKDNVIVIKTAKEFSDYIDKAIEFGRIAVDTETNNSLDPVTCKLMGLCLYVNGEKQAYIPINHTDLLGYRLQWQLTEEDCRFQLQRLIDAGIKIITHNGKFDYEVIKCTCKIAIPIYWDTFIAARLLDENDLAGLKYLYTKFIDKSQSKYDIEELFENIPYAVVDPDIFALYAATDAFLTDSLYRLQYNELYNSFKYEQLEVKTDNFELFYLTEIETTRGYVKAKDLVEADLIKSDSSLLKINKIVNNFNKVTIFYSLN